MEVRLWNGDEFEQARNIEYANAVKTVGQGSSRFREYNLQRIQSMIEGLIEEEEMNQRQRMKVNEGYDKDNQSKKGRMNAQRWVSELLAADCEKAWLYAG